MIALYAVMPGFSASGGRDFSLVSSLLLLPANQPPALTVAWTLVHEIQFYAVFLLFFISGRLLTVFLVLWFCGGRGSWSPIWFTHHRVGLNIHSAC